ncbi:MAG: VWA domain-containing protein, partial [Treponema sp.]|nr:VWA domain-containing protein [Treponema sp.]
MRKHVVLTISLLFFFLSGAAVSIPAQQRPRDVILVVDLSSSMSPHYNNVTSYLTGRFLEENLNLGDTFHLIAFAAKPRLEIVRRVLDEGDVRTINGRIHLLYPLEPASDPLSALNYAERYVQNIPGGRQKKIFFVSDDEGIGVLAAAPRSGTEIQLIKAPVAGTRRQSAEASPRRTVSPSRPDPSPAGTAAVPVVPARTETPADPLQPVPATTVTESAGPADTGGESAAGLEPPPVKSPAETSDPPAEGPSGEISRVEAAIVPDSSPAPDAAAETDSAGLGGLLSSLPFPLVIALAALAILVIAALLILIVRNLQSSPGRTPVPPSAPNRAADTFPAVEENRSKNLRKASEGAELLSSFAEHRRTASQAGPQPSRKEEEPDQTLSTPPLVNFFVEDQNTAIGRRNIHALKPGNSYSVGGGNSDFLIFLVPVPQRIGELHYDGTNCTFIPL